MARLFVPRDHRGGDFTVIDKKSLNKRNLILNIAYPFLYCNLCVLFSGKVMSLSWDPKGPRFAVIQGEQGRTDVSFFKIGEKILPIGKTLTNKKCNCIKWSPLGNLSFFAFLLT